MAVISPLRNSTVKAQSYARTGISARIVDSRHSVIRHLNVYGILRGEREVSRSIRVAAEKKLQRNPCKGAEGCAGNILYASSL